MTVEITPRGTYGAKQPRGMPMPLMKVGMSVVSFFMRLRGMTVVTITTTGAKTGQKRTTDLIGIREGPSTWIRARACAPTGMNERATTLDPARCATPAGAPGPTGIAGARSDRGSRPLPRCRPM